MTTFSRLSAAVLGAALVYSPALAFAQHNTAQPETAIPRQPSRQAGHGGFAPPPNAKPIPPPHGTVQAHAKHSRKDAKKDKTRNAGADEVAKKK